MHMQAITLYSLQNLTLSAPDSGPIVPTSTATSKDLPTGTQGDRINYA